MFTNKYFDKFKCKIFWSIFISDVSHCHHDFAVSFVVNNTANKVLVIFALQCRRSHYYLCSIGFTLCVVHYWFTGICLNGNEKTSISSSLVAIVSLFVCSLRNTKHRKHISDLFIFLYSDIIFLYSASYNFIFIILLWILY